MSKSSGEVIRAELSVPFESAVAAAWGVALWPVGELNEPAVVVVAAGEDDDDDDEVPLISTFIKLVDALPFISTSESISL